MGTVDSNLILYECVTGSKGYNLHNENSDTDTRGVFAVPLTDLFRLEDEFEEIRDGATDTVHYELKKFLKLCLACNPNIIEMLWTPLVTKSTPLFEVIRSNRKKFISRRAVRTYTGYAYAQLDKFIKSLSNSEEPDWKNAMHVVRLCIDGLHILEEGEPVVVMNDARRELLLNIRNGKVPPDDIKDLHLVLKTRMEVALERTEVPLEPDTAFAKNLLMEFRVNQCVSLTHYYEAFGLR